MRVISVDGVVVERLHAASGFTIAAQMPCFEKEIPGIKASYHGTINLYLERQLRIDNPDREILCVCWARRNVRLSRNHNRIPD